jgi:hypothetical protein
MPRNRPPLFNPQRRPNPEKQPAAAAVIPHARRQEYNKNVSALIYTLTMYFSRALIRLAL